MEILEHVSKEQGHEYNMLINEIIKLFPEITIENIKAFAEINDKYGYPQKYSFSLSDNSIVSCSPTSLRYISFIINIKLL